MWLADDAGQPAGEHALDAVLGLPEKTRAQQNDDCRVNPPQTAERFFSVHERHGKIEQNQIKRAWPRPKLFQAVETGGAGLNLEASFGEEALRQNAGGGLVVHHKDSARMAGYSG